MACVFCERLSAGDFVVANDLAVAIPDRFPLNPGHTLILPRRHEADFLALARDEQLAVWLLLETVRDHVTRQFRPDGYNVGINIGAAAGQTIGHAHLHIIPRYAGDVDDPRGGVRWIIAARARYW